MKLTKTEQKILDRLSASPRSRCCARGKRENNAAKALVSKGLINYRNETAYVPPQCSNLRNRVGDYVGFFTYGGIVTAA